MRCSEKFATEKLVNKLQKTFLQQFMEKSVEKSLEELRHGAHIGLRYPREILFPRTLSDLETVLKVVECRYIVAELARQHYNSLARYEKEESFGCIGDYYVLTRSETHSWVIDVDKEYDTCYLKYCENEEIEKHNRYYDISFRILAIELGIDLSYFRDFLNNVS